MLAALLPETGGALRVGISGVPGAGKSTLIEALGLQLLEAGHRVAVLAVDPSSNRSGGSILGDKTRMQELPATEAAFIRPSPTGGTLGGIARRTREAMLVCEAAGFDVVIVETVGVGQSETAVADMVDMFLLLLLPGGGDELQGIKKGIVELADALVINKADGELKQDAQRVAADYRAALRFLRQGPGDWRPPVLLISALEGEGIDTLWDCVERFRAAARDSGAWQGRRADQARRALWNELREASAGGADRRRRPGRAGRQSGTGRGARPVAAGRRRPPATGCLSPRRNGCRGDGSGHGSRLTAPCGPVTNPPPGPAGCAREIFIALARPSEVPARAPASG